MFFFLVYKFNLSLFKFMKMLSENVFHLEGCLAKKGGEVQYLNKILCFELSKSRSLWEIHEF